MIGRRASATSYLPAQKPPELRGSKSLSENRVTQSQRTDGVLMEDQKGYAAFDQVMSERRNVKGDLKRRCDQRDELNKEIQARTTPRLELILKLCRRCASASEIERDL